MPGSRAPAGHLLLSSGTCPRCGTARIADAAHVPCIPSRDVQDGKGGGLLHNTRPGRHFQLAILCVPEYHQGMHDVTSSSSALLNLVVAAGATCCITVCLGWWPTAPAVLLHTQWAVKPFHPTPAAGKQGASLCASACRVAICVHQPAARQMCGVNAAATASSDHT